MNGFVQAGGIFVTMLTKESALSGLSMSAPFMDGVRRCSRKTPGGIGFRHDPSLDSRSAASFCPLGTYLTSYPKKLLDISSTSSRYAAIVGFRAFQVSA